jgi:hypothetical protein
MFGRLIAIWRNRTAPLTGAPPVRRQKTYSSDSGYVYQYYYQGHRPVRGGTEYVFDVSSGPKRSFPVTVVVSEESVRTWEEAHERSLSATERYAVAKLALFRAFDERPAPARLREPVYVRPADLTDILETLGID